MKDRLPFLLLSLIFLWSCGDVPHDESSPDASHSHDGTAHTHADEAATVSVTVWTSDLELFMEHPVLRVGTPAKFAVHLTKLSNFQPVAQGPVLFRFTRGGSSPKMVTVGAPEVPGIFGPTLTFEQAGEYTLHLEILSDEIETSLEYGPVKVFHGDEQIEETGEPDTGQTISFLKEQQWKLPFGTLKAEEQTVRETLRVPAEIKAKAGTESVVSPSVNGRYLPPESGMPRLGTRVRKGTLLGYLELLPADRSNLLDSQVSTGISVSRLMQDLAQAEAMVSTELARLELAEKEARRVTTLVEAEALPARRLDEAQAELEVRRAALSAARRSLEAYQNALSSYEQSKDALSSMEGRLNLQAPVSGQLTEVHAVPGQFVDARQALFRIVDLSIVWAEGQVYENDLPMLEDLEGGVLELLALGGVSLERSALVLIGSTLDPSTRTLPLIFEIENRDERIKLGALGQLELETGASVRTLAVPHSAVLLEENRSVIYVQLGGETFERRPVTTGVQDRYWIQILEGLEAGERIVTVGAYDVALAARSTEVPEHGHVH